MKNNKVIRGLFFLIAFTSCSQYELEALGVNPCTNVKFSVDNIEVIKKDEINKCKLIKEGLSTHKCVEYYPAKKLYVEKLKKQTEFHGGNALLLTKESEHDIFGDAYFCSELVRKK